MRRYVLPPLLVLLLAGFAFGMQVGTSRSPLLVTPDASDARPGPLPFPPGFLWGTAIAGQQAET